MEIKKSNTSFWKNIFVFLLAAALYILILVLRVPNAFRPAIIQMRFGFTIPIPIIFILLIIILSKDRWINSAGAFVFITVIFAMALAGLWASGQTEGQVISGILPDTDAAQYYFDGLRYINGFSFSYFGARRIFFPAFLGILLKITAANIQATLGIITFLVAVSCFYATRAVWKRLGAIPASLFFVLLFSFARLSVGKLMSESLGLILGCLSFYFFMLYPDSKNKWQLLLASIALVLGLIARAGPVGIFPFLMLGIYLLEKKERSAFKIVGISVLAIALVILSFMGISSLLSPQDSIPFANFAHSLYGLATGGTGWVSIYSDHPEVTSMQDPELTKTIFAYSLQAIKDNPLNLLKGIFSQYPQTINFPDRKGFFSFFGGENKIIYYFAQTGIFGLFFYAIYYILKNPAYKKYQFLLYALLGILLSVPFFPFSDFKEMRVHATVIPYIIILPTIGLTAILDKSPLKKVNRQPEDYGNPAVPTAITLLLIVCTLIGPLLVGGFSAQSIPQYSHECPNGESSLTVKISAGSYFVLLRESDLYLDWLPYYHESRFRTNLHNLQYYAVEAFENVSAPALITSTIDLQSGEAAILIFPGEEELQYNTTLLLCGQWDDYEYAAHNANLFFVNSVLPIE